MPNRVQNYSVALAWVQARGTTPGKKRRPVYILDATATSVTFLIITTKYDNKSPFVKQFYSRVEDWAQANLAAPSWVNTYEVYQASLRDVGVTVIGFLSEQDTDRLFHLIAEHDKLLATRPSETTGNITIVD